MVYNPTNFVSGQGPAFDSVEANKMGQGIKDAHEQLERLAYDVYNLYQEQYYTGNSPVSPSAGAAKSLVFDTFSKEGTYNTAGSTVMFATDRITAGYQNQGYQYASSAYDYNFNGFTKSSGTFYSGDPSALLMDDSTYVGFNNASSSYYWPMRLDLGSSKLITGIEWWGYMYSGGNLQQFSLWYQKGDGTYYRLWGDYPTYNNSTPQTFSFSTLDIMTMKTQSSFYFNIYSGNQSSATAMMDYIKFMVATFVASTYKSKPFTLDFTPTGAAAFISEKKEGASTVAPKLNCGGTLVPGVATDSRPDPNFAGFTEIKYEFDLTGKVAPTEFQMILSPSGNNLPYVKRYGVYFY